MSRTRKHFEDMASELKTWADYETKLDNIDEYRKLVRRMGDVCARANSNFDRNKFEEACGL